MRTMFVLVVFFLIGLVYMSANWLADPDWPSQSKPLVIGGFLGCVALIYIMTRDPSHAMAFGLGCALGLPGAVVVSVIYIRVYSRSRLERHGKTVHKRPRAEQVYYLPTAPGRPAEDDPNWVNYKPGH